MVDAVSEKAVLLLHNFARNFQYRTGALIERFHKPIGVGMTFTHKFFGLFVPAKCLNFIVITVIHQHARERVGVKLYRPAPLGCFANKDIWLHRRRHFPAIGQARFRRERFNARNPLHQCLFIHFA